MYFNEYQTRLILLKLNKASLYIFYNLYQIITTYLEGQMPVVTWQPRQRQREMSLEEGNKAELSVSQWNTHSQTDQSLYDIQAAKDTSSSTLHAHHVCPLQ